MNVLKSRPTGIQCRCTCISGGRRLHDCWEVLCIWVPLQPMWYSCSAFIVHTPQMLIWRGSVVSSQPQAIYCTYPIPSIDRLYLASYFLLPVCVDDSNGSHHFCQVVYHFPYGFTPTFASHRMQRRRSPSTQHGLAPWMKPGYKSESRFLDLCKCPPSSNTTSIFILQTNWMQRHYLLTNRLSSLLNLKQNKQESFNLGNNILSYM